eukprot:TRINITY_DN43418_c0_g2_i1.p1 TRINITY_DN43418_c0_g2~~TRINITY_DN43418_c0_g2_i1.p1  ORF type:complete len:283 (-),score=62.04 TRINITY_DN43418_c0_g2_i1:329-1153(-)
MDVYQVVGVKKDATLEEIKKAYKKQALRLHPDKNQDDEESKEKFQQLQRAYVILSDPQKREIYDETGEVEDAEEMGDQDYAEMCPTITLEDIQQFQDYYRGSEEETQDLIELYKQFKGDMDMVFEFLMCNIRELDEHRFMDIIQQAIDEGKIKSYKKFSKWSSEVEKRPAPKDPLGQAKAQTSGLASAILGKKTKQQKNFDSMVSALEEKYGPSSKKQKNGKTKASKKKNVEEDFQEPTEEEFLAARARLENKNINNNSQKENIKNDQKRRRGK